MFFDEAKIYLKAGDGGNGVVAFRREAHVPRGGPSGGNGGKGGDVYLVADLQINTLIAFSKQIHFRASSGDHGRGKNQTGAGGEDLLIHVPVGTVAFEAETDLILADLVNPDQRVLIARGGRAAAATGPSSPRRCRRRASPRTASRAKNAGSGWS